MLSTCQPYIRASSIYWALTYVLSHVLSSFNDLNEASQPYYKVGIIISILLMEKLRLLEVKQLV